MSHMLGHFVSEGIGMRHLIDYYYVLKKLHEDGVKEEFSSIFSHLGLFSFSRGVMWIENKILGLDEKKIITPISEGAGRIIFNSMMAGGNFGFYRAENIIRKKSIFKRGLIDAYRMIKIVPVQPSEVFYRLKHKICNVESMKQIVM